MLCVKSGLRLLRFLQKVEHYSHIRAYFYCSLGAKRHHLRYAAYISNAMCWCCDRVKSMRKRSTTKKVNLNVPEEYTFFGWLFKNSFLLGEGSKFTFVTLYKFTFWSEFLKNHFFLSGFCNSLFWGWVGSEFTFLLVTFKQFIFWRVGSEFISFCDFLKIHFFGESAHNWGESPDNSCFVSEFCSSLFVVVYLFCIKRDKSKKFRVITKNLVCIFVMCRAKSGLRSLRFSRNVSH